MSQTYDFIIIGAGSAGCVLAERLSANGKFSVLIVEAGGSDRRFWVRAPIGYGVTFSDETLNWKYWTEPDPGIAGRSNYWPRGKIMGGSHSINAMVYIRGQAEDYEDWESAGNPGWGYEDVLPYFKKSENNDLGEDAYHGASGPLNVSSVTVHPTTHTFIEAGRELGTPFNPDFNGPSQEGVGPYQITTRKGMRCTTAVAFLRPALRRANVHLVTKAHVSRILFKGSCATGVEYERKGQRFTAQAGREVIVCGGAINTPQLLQLSGVGPSELLRKHGIAPVLDAPAVGQNLQDHLCFPHLFKTTQPTLNDDLHGWSGKMRAGLQYVLTRRGPLSCSINHGGAFVRTDETMSRPNMQLYYIPATYATGGFGQARLDPFSGACLVFSPCRPTSRGEINIASPDFREHPSIRPNYLSTNFDVQDALAGAHYVRKLTQTKAFTPLKGENIQPWPEEDEALIEHLRNIATTTFHPISTCIMGPDKTKSVVDARLNVHGLDHLRIVDASVMPTMPSGNTNAPVVMIAERAADFILEDHQS